MADIPYLDLSSVNWSSFGQLATTTNAILVRSNAFGDNTDVTIVGGSIDGTDIGVADPANAEFNTVVINTTLDLTTANLILSDDSISGDKINGGTLSVSNAIITNQPTLSSHATNKEYVDTKINTLKNEMIAYSIIFGG